MIAASAVWQRVRSPFTLALAVVWLAALALRLYGLNWDEGQDLHPDELFVAKLVLVGQIDPGWPPDFGALLDPATSPLNPRSDNPETGEAHDYAYGALPLLVTDAVAGVVSLLSGTDWNAGERVYLVGRVLSALLDSGTVLIVATMARRLGGPWTGIAAALVAALTPMMIQLAHFFTTDSWLTFFVAACLLFCMRAIDRRRVADLAFAGALAGLAMATKGSVFTLFGVVALVAPMQILANQPGGLLGPVVGLTRRLVVIGAAGFAGFALFEPYALARPGVYLQALRTQSDIVRGIFDVPFSRVFVGTTPLDTVWQWFRWGYGPVAALLALWGLVLLTRRVRLDRGGMALPLLVWLGGYTLVVGVAEVRFLRYLAPVTPVLAVAAGLALNRLRQSNWARMPQAGPRLAAAAMVGVALWTAAFAAVYAGEHPRLAASRWIYAAAPAGSSLTAEYWDDALPRDFGVALSPPAFRYATVQVDSYADLPPADASAHLFDALAAADFVAISSNRVEAATAAAPWRYAVANAFFRMLSEGDLGFTLVEQWDNPPRLGPLRLDDADADESFVNYDHPTVRIFARDGPLDRAAWDARMAWATAQPWIPLRQEPSPSLLLDRPVGELPEAGDARWSATVTSNPAGAVIVWIALLVVLQLVGTPLARRALPRFADRGWGLARLLALLVVGYAVWLAASVRIIAFGPLWCWLALCAVGGVGWWLSRRRRPLADAMPRAPAERGAELAFWGVFALFLLFRFLNPDGWHPFWGGEKPMEFAHLNATLRSAHLPPYDPWFSDGIINYYYYGLYLVAVLVMLTGIPSEIAFNLAQPTMLALFASALFSVASAIGRDLARSERTGLVAGAAAVAFGVLVGNLTTAASLLTGSAAPADSFVDWVWNGSRAIGDAITEFPFFTGLYADLHAHVVALPITVLAIALAYALAFGHWSVARWQDPLVPFGLLSLTLGTLSATNAWDVPTYAALAVAALWMASAAVTGWARRMAVFSAGSVLLAAAAYALFLPFHANFVALFGSLAPVREPTSLGEWAVHLGGLALVSLLGLLVLLGRQVAGGRVDLVVVAAVGLAVLSAGQIVWSIVAGSPPVWFAPGVAVLAAAVLLLGAVGVLPRRRDRDEAWLDRAPLFLGASLAVAAMASGRAVLAVALAALTLAAVGWLYAATVPVRFVCLLAAAAWGVVAGVELVVVADDLIGGPAYRMNTVFKFYNQVWLLLSMVAGVGVAAAVARFGAAASPVRSTRRRWATATLVAGVVVLLASALYPARATGPRLAQRFPEPPPIGTLNAWDWMDAASLPSLGYDDGAIRYGGDRAAIDWFNREVGGSPVVAEAAIGPYRCNGSRISIGTGLPTILGWERHQQQQRPLAQLDGRAADIERLYRSTDTSEKESILRRYDVAFVVVGDLERAYPTSNNECRATSPTVGIAALEAMAGTVLEEAFRAGPTLVYRVLPPPPVAAASRLASAVPGNSDE
jgi:YYY domain-containing protein